MGWVSGSRGGAERMGMIHAGIAGGYRSFVMAMGIAINGSFAGNAVRMRGEGAGCGS